MNDADSPLALIVEDDRNIRRFVRSALEAEGWRIREAETVREGLAEARSARPRLVVVDLGLPDGDGVELIAGIRESSRVPIVVLSARSEEAQKVRALDAGADDYVEKPFRAAEFLARVRAHMRRHGAVAAGHEGAVRIGDVVFDATAHIVRKGEREVHLTPIEFKLLGVLVANAGRVLTHRTLLREVWGPGRVEHNHYLRVFMGSLRQKLEDDPAQPRMLVTETGVGYRLLGG